jgi:hypothetical protein
MNIRLVEHLLAMLLVTTAFIVLVAVVAKRDAAASAGRVHELERYLHLDGVDFSDPRDRALFRETLNLFHPDRVAGNDSLVQTIERYRQEQLAALTSKTGGEERGLSAARLRSLGGMYLQFIFAYLVVMIITYRGAQSLAVFRFVRMQQGRPSYLRQLAERSSARRRAAMPLLAAKALAKGIAYAILFSPAYVIAYALRSGVETDSLPFMIILGVLSNGLLIGAANRFSAFLSTESRKGYVQTAMVKNLDASYEWGDRPGIPPAAILRPMGLVPSHVFRHIFLNARYQSIPTLKEHASFLITGLIIIEMALNIQGHLGYELLRTILYRQYDVTLAIVLGVFLIVKATDIAVDLWFLRETRRYGNIG